MILWRDDRFVASDKPSGLLVHRGWARDRDVLMARVRDAVGTRVHPIHRLDRGASGVVLFALDPEAAREASALFERRAVDKLYWALVRGAPPEALTIDHPIPNDEDGARVPAVTEVRRVAQLGRYAVVEARPRTGRLHQIRRHLKHISCPLIGDVRYGKGPHNRLFRDRFGLHRLALHALELAFDHPFTGARVVVRAALPDELRRVIAELGAAS